MICKDMKYTALYWALRYVEINEDVHEKDYNGFKVTIKAEEQLALLGNRDLSLTAHKDFVVLELVDRLLTEGFTIENIDFSQSEYDVVLNCDDGAKIGFICAEWDDYKTMTPPEKGVLYSSRLVSGLLEYEYKNNSGHSLPLCFNLSSRRCILNNHTGNEKIVEINDDCTSIAACTFWDNSYIEEVILPDSLEEIGGDCFYHCKNLRKLTIPKNVKVMGNNPFAGCPNLKLENTSPYFTLVDGVLYDRDMTTLIYYPINDTRTSFTVPDGVRCLGKHCFFGCNNLRHITIPASVTKFENNPFSGCEQLEIDNYSLHYHIENGVIYNRYRTEIIGCFNGTKAECITLPDGLKSINRNAFWNCKGIEKIIIPRSVTRIGYNPFAGCENLIIDGENGNFIFKDGFVYDKDGSHLLCATDRAVGRNCRIPDNVTHINRGVFSGCVSLEKIDFNKVTYIDKSSFTNCISLTELYIPDAVTYIGEWAFAYCINLKKTSIKQGTVIDKNAFNSCPVEIEWR